MRISATTLESFRLWSEGEWMPEAELQATIRGTLIQTPKMLLGQAFGRCLEKGETYVKEDGNYHVPVRFFDEWRFYVFTPELMKPCLAEFDRRGIFEAKATREYGNVTVVAKADQILGSGIIENKCKLASSFDFDRYAESYQWRLELDLFEGATSINYKIFLLDEEKNGEYTLRGIENFKLYPYPGMHDDCSLLVSDFVDYVRFRKLESFLEPKHVAMI